MSWLLRVRSSAFGRGLTLRELNDREGKALIHGVLELVDRLKPLHLSIVGGDPLVRYRELEAMVPLLLARGIHVQIVTSAFRPSARDWAALPHMNVVVSIDGLQPEHDVRRSPATYESNPKEYCGSEDHHPLHYNQSNDEAAGILERLSRVLDAASQDQQGLVQYLHATKGR